MRTTEKVACLVEVMCMHSSWLHGTDQAKKGRLHACMPVYQGKKLLGRQYTRDSYKYESLSDKASFSEIPRAPAQILRQEIWEANTYILIRRKSKIASVVKNRDRNYYYFCWGRPPEKHQEVTHVDFYMFKGDWMGPTKLADPGVSLN